MNEVQSTQGKIEDVEDDWRDDEPVVNVGEDEGIGGQSEDDVPQVEGEVAEGHTYGQFGPEHAVVCRRDHRGGVQVKNRLQDGEEREEHGGHGDGGKTGHSSQRVLNTRGWERLVPWEAENTPQHQPE